MALTGKRALVQDIDRTREAKVISYPSEGEGDFAMVHFDGDPEPVTIHKSRVHKIIPNQAEALARVTGSKSATVARERRNLDGSLTVEHVETFERD